MTKSELIDKIWEDIPLHRRGKFQKQWVRFVVEEVFDNIKECALIGEPVSIHRFGKFIPRRIPPKRIWNPGTMSYQMSEAKLKLRFKTGTVFKELLQKEVT